MNIADSLLTLADNVTAASAKLNLTGTAKALLTDNATAGEATVNVSKDSTLALEENASGGSASVNNSGLMTFADQALAENTVVKKPGGRQGRYQRSRQRNIYRLVVRRGECRTGQ